MSYPTPYDRQYNFVDYQAVNPSLPLPADQVEAELNAVELSLDETQANLAAIQRSDNKLGNLVVHPESLDSATLTLIGGYTLRGAWVTATAYAVKDLVTQSGNLYFCLVAHTSGTFATDLAANKWMVLSKTGLQPDGSVTPTANQPMGGFKFINLGPGTARTDSVNLGQIQDETTQWAAVSGTGDAIVLTMTPAVSVNVAGQCFRFKATANNTTTTTLNAGGGALPVQYNGSALAGGEIKTGRSYMVLSDGAAWQLFTLPEYPIAIAKGGTGQITALAAFDALKQVASETYQGVAEIATQAETDAGTDDLRQVTPLKLWTTKIRGGWKNIVGANGGFEVWQRGAGGSASIAVAASQNQYTADRWYLNTNANQASVVAQVAGLVDASQWAARVQRNNGQTGVGQQHFGFPLDADEVIKLRGKKVSVRFLARAGANWSPASGTLACIFNTGTGAGASKLAGFTGNVQQLSVSVNLTPGGAAVVTMSGQSAALPNTITQGQLSFFWTPVGTAGVNDWFEVDDVDLRVEEPVIDQFERRPFEDELRACMRHYEKSFNYSVAPAQNVASGLDALTYTVRTAAASTHGIPCFYVVPKRVQPSSVTFFNPNAANGNWRNQTLPADSGGPSLVMNSIRSFFVTNPQVAGDAVGNLVNIHWASEAGI